MAEFMTKIIENQGLVGGLLCILIYLMTKREERLETKLDECQKFKEKALTGIITSTTIAVTENTLASQEQRKSNDRLKDTMEKTNIALVKLNGN